MRRSRFFLSRQLINLKPQTDYIFENQARIKVACNRTEYKKTRLLYDVLEIKIRKQVTLHKSKNT